MDGGSGHYTFESSKGIAQEVNLNRTKNCEFL
jgi:hypothetical protein